MTQTKTPRTSLKPGLRAAALAATALLALNGPALADYTRYCNGQLQLTPQNPTMSFLTYDFSVGKSVRFYAQVNDARRDSRARMISCVRDHWSMPEARTRPDACLGIRDYHVRDYPFEHLNEEVAAAICDANPGEDVVLISVDLKITGNTGCVTSGSSDTINIARNYRIDCTAPISDGGGDEAAESPPAIGEGGGWECVGEGCDGAEPPADEPPAEPSPPPAASYQILPVFRLPGNDLYMLDAGDGISNWMSCRQACTEDERCGAWTYRAPANQCLLKHRAGIPIPDPCCTSGIKR